MYHPTLKEARALAAAGPYREIPVARELLSDFLTPIEALRILRARDNHCFLLESAADSGGWGRWSFLGFEPDLEITCKDGVVRLRDGERVSTQIRRPGEALRELLAAHRSPRVPGLPPFTSTGAAFLCRPGPRFPHFISIGGNPHDQEVRPERTARDVPCLL